MIETTQKIVQSQRPPLQPGQLDRPIAIDSLNPLKQLLCAAVPMRVKGNLRNRTQSRLQKGRNPSTIRAIGIDKNA